MVRGLDPALLTTVAHRASEKINQLNMEAAMRMANVTEVQVHAEMYQRHEAERSAWRAELQTFKQSVVDEAKAEVDRIVL